MKKRSDQDTAESTRANMAHPERGELEPKMATEWVPVCLCAFVSFCLCLGEPRSLQPHPSRSPQLYLVEHFNGFLMWFVTRR